MEERRQKTEEGRQKKEGGRSKTDEGRRFQYSRLRAVISTKMIRTANQIIRLQ